MVNYYSTTTKNIIMPFAAIWKELDFTKISEGSQKQRQIPYDITFMWNYKYDTNEFIYTTERGTHTE